MTRAKTETNRQWECWHNNDCFVHNPGINPLLTIRSKLVAIHFVHYFKPSHSDCCHEEAATIRRTVWHKTIQCDWSHYCHPWFFTTNHHTKRTHSWTEMSELYSAMHYLPFVQFKSHRVELSSYLHNWKLVDCVMWVWEFGQFLCGQRKDMCRMTLFEEQQTERLNKQSHIFQKSAALRIYVALKCTKNTDNKKKLIHLQQMQRSRNVRSTGQSLFSSLYVCHIWISQRRSQFYRFIFDTNDL